VLTRYEVHVNTLFPSLNLHEDPFKEDAVGEVYKISLDVGCHE